MKILSFSLSQLQVNCYFVIKNNKCLIIDPADEADFILEKIQQLKLDPVAMVATHGHFDHIMAAGEIQLSYNIPFYIHQNDIFLLDRLEQTAQYFLGYKPAIIKPKNITTISKLALHVTRFALQVIKTPGHTPGSISLYYDNYHPELACLTARQASGSPILFSGDTLFKQGVGRTDFSYSSASDLEKSLKKLFQLPKKTIVYPGHGDKTTIKQEKSII